jgi:hypothetical protein
VWHATSDGNEGSGNYGSLGLAALILVEDGRGADASNLYTAERWPFLDNNLTSVSTAPRGKVEINHMLCKPRTTPTATYRFAW